MGQNPHKPFKPKPEQQALVPDVSGNAINGLGETEFRRPSHVYWHDPDLIAHGNMQRWFYSQNADDADINRERAEREKVLDVDIPAVAKDRRDGSATEFTRRLESYAKTLDFELFGITAFDPDWVFDDMEADGKWVVMIGVAHDYERIREAPANVAGAEVIRQYGRAGRASKQLTAWIRSQGWSADALAGPMAGRMVLIPPAIACGFGELGKHGSIINKEYGSSFRLAGVLTDMPLEPTEAVSYGVDDFCSRCQVCANACPGEAILPEKVHVRGVRKWYVDFDKCLPFFNEHSGCSICIAVCPWSIPGRGPRIVEQLMRRAAKRAEPAPD